MEFDNYTHAEWRVTPGRADEFIEAWRALGEVFASLERPPVWGTLLQSTTDTSVFYSFGPWASAEDMAAMRADETALAALKRVSDLCESANPGPCRRVLHIDLSDRHG
jgi:hypothetical protein